MPLARFLQQVTNTARSFRFIKKTIENGYCRLNALYELFPSKKVQAKDRVELAFLWETWTEASIVYKPICILYEDQHFLVIDKPIGLESESEALEKYLQRKIWLVHRLDKSTSGVLLLAKTFAAFNQMKNLFVKRQIQKNYIAIVDGKPLRKKMHIESFLSVKKTYQGQKLYASSSKGKLAISDFSLITYNNHISCIFCDLITGRTHQLRVHLKEMGCPILGDFLYSKTFRYPHFVSRLYLHSLQMSFLHPYTKKILQIKASLPQDFYEILPSIPQKYKE